MAHLHNAVQQKQLLHGRWSLMDQAIQAYAKELFSGELPTTTRQIFNRFAITNGVPVTSFARHRRDRSPSLSFSVPKGIEDVFEVPKTSNSIREHFNGKASGENLMDNILKNRTETRGNSRRYVFSHLQKLEQLRDCLRESTPTFQNNIIPLSRQCDQVLLQIREALKSELDVEHIQNGCDIAEVYKPADVMAVMEISHGVFVPEMTAKNAGRGRKPVSVAHKLKHPEQTFGQLRIAAEVGSFNVSCRWQFDL